MELFTKNRYLKQPQNAVEEIIKLYNLDKPGRMDEALNILQKWIEKQDHILKKDFTRDYLARALLTTKGSVERAKKQIDRLCTLKTLLPHFFTATNAKVDLKEMLTAGPSPVLMPVMTEDLYRVVLVKTDKSISEKIIFMYCQYVIIICEYLKAHDCINGLIIIVDFRESDILDLITKINPVVMQQIMTILIEGCGARIKGIYILSQSKAIDLLIKMIKQFLSQKILSRCHVIKTLEELHEVVPKDILPVEYEGKERSLDMLIEDWVEELSCEEHVEYMKMMRKACTNESLRKSDQFNEEYMGTPGSFRNMTVD